MARAVRHFIAPYPNGEAGLFPLMMFNDDQLIYFKKYGASKYAHIRQLRAGVSIRVSAHALVCGIVQYSLAAFGHSG